MDHPQLNRPPGGQADPAAAPELPPWRFRASRRARNLRVQVFPTGEVEIVVPAGTRPRTLQAFVEEHRAWIVRSQLEFLTARPPQPTVPEHIELAAIGERLRVTWVRGERAGARRNGDDLLVFSPERTAAQVRPVLQNWLKGTARRHLAATQRELSTLTGLQPQALQVRLQKTRWGSCSPTGTISLNAAVLLRSPAELRYVVLHELCHLRHLNHSRRFWALVERYEPDYRAIDRRLGAAWAETPHWIY